MAWTTIPNSLVAVGAKPFATTVQAFRDNIEAVAEKDATMPVGLRLGTWLLGTINTTSGNTQTLSGLNLTEFEYLIFEANGITGSNMIIYLESFSNQFNSGASSSAHFGTVTCSLVTGFARGLFEVSTAGAAGTMRKARIGYTKSTTSVSVSTSGPGFTAGSLLVYGVK